MGEIGRERTAGDGDSDPSRPNDVRRGESSDGRRASRGLEGVGVGGGDGEEFEGRWVEEEDVSPRCDGETTRVRDIDGERARLRLVSRGLTCDGEDGALRGR